MKVIAIIPARGGSKGIPRKNILEIDGVPLIGYSIQSALASSMISRVVVTSDDEEILNYASQYSQVILHRRDTLLATDFSPIENTIETIVNENKGFDFAVILQPTSPLRTGEEIDNAIQLINDNNEANSLISVIPVDDLHPARMYWKKDLLLDPIMKEFESRRRQEIPTAYYRNGSIYIVRIEQFVAHKKVMIKPSLAFEMSPEFLLNIDDKRDLLIAEPLFKEWKKRSNESI